MRFFIIADIHGNLPALAAVFSDFLRFDPHFNTADAQADRLVCLGDVIGYYAHPNEVMELIWSVTNDILIGNHERSVYGLLHPDENPGPTEKMNQYAQWAIHWTAAHLQSENQQRLNDLMASNRYVLKDQSQRIIFAHAAPYIPELMDYVTSGAEAYSCFFERPEFEQLRVAFVGHSHLPQFYTLIKSATAWLPTVFGGRVLFRKPGEQTEADRELSVQAQNLLVCTQTDERAFEKTWDLTRFAQTFISVPAVGQPRDGLPYTGYAIYEPAKMELKFVRIPYDLELVMSAMRALEGCPAKLIDRLPLGK